MSKNKYYKIGETFQEDGKTYFSCGETGQGYVFKSERAFAEKKGVCYIAECFFTSPDDIETFEDENGVVWLAVDGDGTTQFTTYQSIYDEVQECAEDLLGNEFTSLPKDMQDKFVDKLTAAVFDIVDWQMTSSYIYVDLDIDEEFEYFLSDNCSQ